MPPLVQLSLSSFAKCEMWQFFNHENEGSERENAQRFFHNLGIICLQKLLLAKRVSCPIKAKISFSLSKVICHTTKIPIHNWLWLNFGSSPPFLRWKERVNDFLLNWCMKWILSLRYQGGERRRRYKMKTQCTVGPVKVTSWFQGIILDFCKFDRNWAYLLQCKSLYWVWMS